MKTFIVAIAGSTAHTVQCADSLFASPMFTVAWVLTPEPKPSGRKQVLTPNPLQQYGQAKDIPTVLLRSAIDAEIASQLQAVNTAQPIDFLVVVDFGYIIPPWLLELPKIAALNIHPSTLPRWRGSSPGQFSLLYGDKTSAVSVIVMDKGMDTGPVVQQLPFTVQPNWTQTEYYDFSFELIAKQLPEIVEQFGTGKLTAQPQAAAPATPLARRLRREDGFVEWKLIERVLNQQDITDQDFGSTSPLLVEVAKELGSWSKTIENAVRAFKPWPLVWTIISTPKGEKRMQILSLRLNQEHQLELDEVKIEGQTVAEWAKVKNLTSLF